MTTVSGAEFSSSTDAAIDQEALTVARHDVLIAAIEEPASRMRVSKPGRAGVDGGRRRVDRHRHQSAVERQVEKSPSRPAA